MSNEKGCIGAHIMRHVCFLDRHQDENMLVECCNTTLCNRDTDSFLKRVDKEINVGYDEPLGKYYGILHSLNFRYNSADSHQNKLNLRLLKFQVENMLLFETYHFDFKRFLVLSNIIQLISAPANSNVLMVIIGAAGTLVLVIFSFGIYKFFRSRMMKKILGYEKDPYVAVAKEPQYTNHILDEISLSNTSGAGRTQFVQVQSDTLTDQNTD